jgi:hypothetical protein
VVLDWEEDKALRILLEQWLICLFALDGRSNARLLIRRRVFFIVEHWDANDGDGDLTVLLVGSSEINLLRWRFTHLEALDASRGLFLWSANCGRRDGRFTGSGERTFLEGVIWVAIWKREKEFVCLN